MTICADVEERPFRAALARRRKKGVQPWRSPPVASDGFDLSRDIFPVLGPCHPMRTFFLLLVTLLCTYVAFGQYGRAPNGYYPPAYTGDSFSGKVTAVDEASGQITISFEEKKKAETFVGRLQEPCAVPSKDGKPMTALDLPIGTYVTVFFETSVRKNGNTSVKENSIIGVMFHSWDGHPVKQTAKKTYLCSKPTSQYFRCFSPPGAGCLESLTR